MSRIIGNTVGTPINPKKVAKVIEERQRKIPYWKDLPDIVASGMHKDRFKVGDQFTVAKGDKILTWDVVGINKDVPTTSNKPNWYLNGTGKAFAPASGGEEMIMHPESQVVGEDVIMSFNTLGTYNSQVYSFPVEVGKSYIFSVENFGPITENAAVIVDANYKVLQVLWGQPYATITDERAKHIYISSSKDSDGTRYFQEAANSLTLQLHDSTSKMQFDAPEALIYFAVGSHPAKKVFQFTIPIEGSDTGNTFFFTIQAPVEPGYFITLNTPVTRKPEDITYKNTTYNIHDASGNVIKANQGIGGGAAAPLHDLGVADGRGRETLSSMGTYINSIDRVINGSANYGESAIRQYLNGEEWTAQTDFDRPPTWLGTPAFTEGMDEEFLKVVSPTYQTTKYNTKFEAIEAPYKYTTEDKFFIPSRTQLFAGVGENAHLQYYEQKSEWGLVNTGVDSAKVKSFDQTGTADSYWTRTTHSGYGCYLSTVMTDGSIAPKFAWDEHPVAPCCCIAGV